MWTVILIPVWTNVDQSGLVGSIWGQFHRTCSRYLSLIWVWKLLVWWRNMWSVVLFINQVTARIPFQYHIRHFIVRSRKVPKERKIGCLNFPIALRFGRGLGIGLIVLCYLDYIISFGGFIWCIYPYHSMCLQCYTNCPSASQWHL